jgi:hypothetical protein
LVWVKTFILSRGDFNKSKLRNQIFFILPCPGKSKWSQLFKTRDVPWAQYSHDLVLVGVLRTYISLPTAFVLSSVVVSRQYLVVHPFIHCLHILSLFLHIFYILIHFYPLFAHFIHYVAHFYPLFCTLFSIIEHFNPLFCTF